MDTVAKTDNEMLHQWFSLRVISGKERVVEENILFESKFNKVVLFFDNLNEGEDDKYYIKQMK